MLVTEHNCNFLLRKGVDKENTMINIWEVLESYGHRPLVPEKYGQRRSSFGKVGMKMNSVVKVRTEKGSFKEVWTEMSDLEKYGQG